MNYTQHARQVLSSLRTHPRKQLGQNFMIDETSLDYIRDRISESRSEKLLEIGPGLGFLTDKLLECHRSLVAIDVDKRFCEYLSQKYAENSAIRIRCEDAIRSDWNTFLDHHSYACVGNIPYQISSPLIEKLIQHRDRIKEAYFTFQKDFADRLLAPVGSRECGALTVWAKFFLDGEVLRVFKPHVFYPQPKIDSCLVRIRVRNVEVLGSLRHLIQACFQQRRKMMVVSLNHAYPQLGKLTIQHLLSDVGISPQARPEALALEQWAALGKSFYERHPERSEGSG